VAPSVRRAPLAGPVAHSRTQLMDAKPRWPRAVCACSHAAMRPSLRRNAGRMGLLVKRRSLMSLRACWARPQTPSASFPSGLSHGCFADATQLLLSERQKRFLVAQLWLLPLSARTARLLRLWSQLPQACEGPRAQALCQELKRYGLK
jgi:hypothetical protein